jgi:hypothetical protein
MTREEMMEDLKKTWVGIQKLDPLSQINMAEAEESWSKLDDIRLQHTYNGARAVLWQMIRQRSKQIG